MEFYAYTEKYLMSDPVFVGIGMIFALSLSLSLSLIILTVKFT
jgi:hypothetical protein